MKNLGCHVAAEDGKGNEHVRNFGRKTAGLFVSGWIGVDLDGTLAMYGRWAGPLEIGEPIAPMVERVKGWLAEGREVRIMTARVAIPEVTPDYVARVEAHAREAGRENFDAQAHIADWSAAVAGIREAIELWCEKHIGQRLAVTCTKDFGMIELWDDRAVRVRMNVGEPCCGDAR
jgi:hypothetical protein